MLARIAVVSLLALSAETASAGPISLAVTANQLRIGDAAAEAISTGRRDLQSAAGVAMSGIQILPTHSLVVLMADDITMLPGYTVDGTIDTSGAGNSVLHVAVSRLDSRSPVAQITHQAHASSTWGVPIGFCLGATSGINISPAGEPGAGYLLTVTCAPGTTGKSTGIGRATASLLNRFGLFGLTVTDPLGDPIGEGQFASASGTELDPNGALTQVVAMPEPASFLLASSGFALAALRRAARKRKTL